MSRAVEAAAMLRRLGACDDAIVWLRERSWRVTPESRTAEAAWLDCKRGDWLVWLVTHERVRVAVGDRALRLIACDCAERALPMYESCRTGDERPRRAIEVARRYADGLATLDELRAARQDVYGAYYAYAAAYAANAAAYAAAAAAAAAAFYANAADAARERQAQADIVRRHVPWAVVRDALRPIAAEVAS